MNGRKILYKTGKEIDITSDNKPFGHIPVTILVSIHYSKLNNKFAFFAFFAKIIFMENSENIDV